MDPDRLKGGDRELAQDIWDQSKGAVNPRYTYGHWLLAQRYELVREHGEGVLQLTKIGRDFLEQPGGKAECAIDEAEGLIKLLFIVADNGPARREDSSRSGATTCRAALLSVPSPLSRKRCAGD